MINELALAIHIAAMAFKDKLDRSNMPYILHCLRVMNDVPSNLKTAAVLHDILEDTEITVNDLIKSNINISTIEIIKLLTHDEKDSYDTYIKKISLFKEATIIKLADLKDNSDITRLKSLNKEDFDRIEKYHKAYIYLKS